MDAMQIDHRARRLVDRLRGRGIAIWVGGSGSVMLSPLAAVGATERAFISSHVEAIAAALEPDAEAQHALDRVAARLAVHAARRRRPSPRRRPVSPSRAHRARVKYIGVASTSRI